MKNKHLRILTAALVFSLCAAPLSVVQAGSPSSQESDNASTGRTAAEESGMSDAGATTLTAAEESGMTDAGDTTLTTAGETGLSAAGDTVLTSAEETGLTAAGDTALTSAEETGLTSTQEPASISSAIENGAAQNAEAAFREFLDGKRSLTWHNDNVTFHFITQKESFADDEEFTVRDLIDRVDQAVKKVTEGSKDASSETELVSAKYALLDGGSLPLLAMLFEIKQPVLFKNEVYCVMYYDPDEDRIHLTFAEDLWTKSRIRINKNGIVTDIVSLSAFETSYVYRQLAGSGDIHFIYSSFYDDRKVSLSDLHDWEKNDYLAVYRVPDKTGIYYTLKRLSGGDPTFVIDLYLDLSAKNPAAALYLEDLEDGTQFVNHSTVISAVLASMNKLGVTPEAFFADEPGWTEFETKE